MTIIITDADDLIPACGIDKEVCEFANYIGEGH